MEVLKIRNDANSPWVDILALVGPKGFSPIVKVEEGEKTITVTVTDEEGQTSAVIDLNNYYNKQETDGAIEAAVTAIDLEPYALKTDIPSLEGYATEDWVTEQIGNIPVIDLTPYALKSEIPVIPVDISAFNNDVGYLTEHQSLDGYAKTEDIPTIPTKVSAFANDVGYLTNHQSLEGYATKEYVDESVSNVDVRLQLNKYALKTEIPTVPDKVSSFENDAGYLTEHQSLEGYATEKYVEEQIKDINIPTVDLAPYALKTDIPTVPTKVSAFENDKGYLTQHQSLDGLASEEYVNTAVSNVKVDLTGYATETYVQEQIEGIEIPEGTQEVYVGSTEPDGDAVLWIDNDEESPVTLATTEYVDTVINTKSIPNATSTVVGGLTVRFQNGVLYIRNDGEEA